MGPERAGDLEAAVEQLRQDNATLARRVDELAEALAGRDARIGELEKLLAEARRSGKRQAAPFSKGEPTEKPKRPGRRAGNKHGRHGHRSAPAAVDNEVEVPLPGCCPDCGGELVHERDADQYVTELPERRPVVTRYRVGIGRCTSCNKRVQGRHPDQRCDALGAAGSMIGPNATALAAWLHYGLGLSFAKSARLLGRLGVPVTAGALCSSAQSTGTALVPVNDEILRHVNESPMVVADETGWRVGGRSAWLWTATSPTATAYNVAEGRGFDEATELIDEDFDGVLVRDGWGTYRGFTQAEHQTCLAHLIRRCDEMIADQPSWSRFTPVWVREILGRALGARKLSKAKRLAVVEDLSELVELLGEDVQLHDENRKLVKHLVKESGALFTFLTHTDVDATNWRAEQAIRPAVVNRKVWGGNRTWRGAATQGRMMSVLRTADQRGIDPVKFLAGFARAPDPAAVSLFA